MATSGRLENFFWASIVMKMSKATAELLPALKVAPGIPKLGGSLPCPVSPYQENLKKIGAVHAS